MASDALRLLFELDVDSRAGTAGLLRFRKDIAATINAARRSLTQPLKSLNTAPLAAATAKAAVSTQELANRQARAAQAAQRLQIGQQRLAVSSNQVAAAQQRAATAVQRAANGQTQAAAGAIRAATAYQRATAAANNFAQSQNTVRRVVESVQSSLRGLGQGLQSVGRTLTVGVTAPILALGAASLKSAKDIDANVNTLKAFTGSAEAAERRLAELIKTSRGTPGLTTNLALTLDAQLRTAQVMVETIDRVLPAIGRLNAVSKLPDAGRFTQNLVQLVTQNFERQDLKELVGQSPIAGQLIRELFNVDSPTNAKAIRESAQKLGINSVDSFFAAFAAAAQRNRGLATVTESIGTRFDKIVDRVTIALRPLGLAIINAIEPFIEPVSKLIERLGEAFNSLSPPVKTAIIVIAGIAAAAGPVLIILGGLVTAITGVVGAIGTIAAAVAAVGLPAIAAGVAGITILVAEWAAILVVLGLAWQKNFLNIRGLVSDAASAVLEAFSRIKAVFDEATLRILPTMQSITTKVVAVITAAWDRYGRFIVTVVGAAFRFIVSITETFLRNFTDFVDLVLKLIDGDWRGAWNAFARIVIRALEQIEFVLTKLPAVLVRTFLRLNQIIVAQGALFAIAAQRLAVEFIASFVAALLKADKAIRLALIDMLISAVSGMDLTTVGAIAVGKLLAAMRKAAAQGVSIPVEVTNEGVTGGGVFKPKPPPASPGDGKDKGADAETKRRIRLLELEAERAEAIARQRIAAENIHFEERRTSLREFTDFQIKEEEIVLAKKKAVFEAERKEAEKLTKGRDLALGEIRLKELKAEIEFFDRRNQLLANQRREEDEAAKEHRQALLDIQDEGDRRQLELIDSYVERSLISFEEAEKRRIKIEEDARDRRRKELELQLGEAGQNVEQRRRIKDAIAKIDAEAASAREEAENRKRRALEATIEAENDYYETLRQITLRASQLLRDAAEIELSRLISKFGDRRRFRLESLRLEREANKEEHEERLRQIEQERIDAEKRLEGVRDAEEKLRKLREYYRNLEKAERKRRAEEKKKEDQDEQREKNPFGPFIDIFNRFKDAVKNANDSIAESVGSLSQSVVAAAANMVDALQQGIVAWVLYGESLGKALKQALAQQLAVLASEFAIQALKHGAYALGSLAFGNFAGAAKHAAAAAAFTAAAAATGLAARALAKSSGLYKPNNNAGTASAAVGGGEPRNREFNYGGQGPVESSARALQDGSGGIFGRFTDEISAIRKDLAERDRLLIGAVERNTQTFSQFGVEGHGVVVKKGAGEASAEIAGAVVSYSDSSGEFNERLQRNLGFA